MAEKLDNVTDLISLHEGVKYRVYDDANGKEVIYKCLCKVVPNVDTKKVRVY